VESGLVNPDFGTAGGLGSGFVEALWVKWVSNIKHILALPQESFPLTISETVAGLTSLSGVTVLLVVTSEKNSDRKHDCPDAPNGPGTRRYFRVGWLSERDCHQRRAADYAFRDT